MKIRIIYSYLILKNSYMMVIYMWMINYSDGNESNLDKNVFYGSNSPN
nr:hypothetical protein CJLB15_00116 [Campylobacter phage CJLB-15]